MKTQQTQWDSIVPPLAALFLSAALMFSVLILSSNHRNNQRPKCAPTWTHLHTHEVSFIVSFVITAIESDILSLRVSLLWTQRAYTCAWLYFCGFSILFLGPKERVHVSVCLFVGFCYFIFVLVWFCFCYWCNHKNRTACVRTRTSTHTRTHLNDSLHPSQWLLIGQFSSRVNVMYFENFCGAINTTQQNSTATFSIKNDTL